MNYIGIFVLIFITLFAIFCRWIYGLNLEIKYSKINLNHNNNMNFYEKIAEKKFTNFEVISPQNFWIPKILFNKKKIFINNSYFKKNIYGVVNLVYFSHKINYLSKKNLLIINIIKYVQTFLLINIWWTLFVDYYYVSIAIAILMLIIFIFYVIYFYNKNLVIYYNTKKFLKNNFDQDNYLILHKYFRYKKFNYLFDMIIVFIEPITSLIPLFKDLSLYG